jgi:hypothetical protein
MGPRLPTLEHARPTVASRQRTGCSQVASRACHTVAADSAVRREDGSAATSRDRVVVRGRGRAYAPHWSRAAECGLELAGPCRSSGLRPYPRQVSNDGRNMAAHPAQVRQSFVTPWTVSPHQKASTRLVLQQVARRVLLASLSLGGRPRDQWSPSPLTSSPRSLPHPSAAQSVAAVLSEPPVLRSRPVARPAPAP